jgi:hypothetical protein
MQVRSHWERGQTLVETALFLPLVLLVLFGTIYVGHLGVVGDRAQLAIRYGGITNFASTSSGIYNNSAIYTAAQNPTLPASCPTPAAFALYDAAPLPGPTTPPYWQPKSVAGTCTPAAYRIGGAQFLASHFFAASNESLTATVDPPLFLEHLNVVGAGQVATAAIAFVHPADPSTILYCSSEVDTRVVAALMAPTTTVTPPPSPLPTPNPSPSALNFKC